MKTFFTPSPWKEIDGFIVGYFQTNGRPYNICDPRCAPADDADMIVEMNANSQLIAAAPLLYEALSNLVQKDLIKDKEGDHYQEAVDALFAASDQITDEEWSKTEF
jgi:hypothetical protein